MGALGRAHQFHPRFGDDAQRALAAHDRAQQIEAGRAINAAAQPHDFAIGQHHFDAQGVIDGDAIFERVRAARIGRDVAADGAGRLT